VQYVKAIFCVVEGGAVSLVSASGIPELNVQVNSSGVHLVLIFPQARLFYYQNGRLPRSYAVAMGKILAKTPTGSFESASIYTALA
jgi:hypothetical protein